MSDIDFSSEALAERAEGFEPETEPQEASEPVEAEQATPDAEPVEEQPDAEESAEPEAPVAEEPDAGEEETYRQRYENLVPKLGEQGKELGELRRQLEELAARTAAEPAPEAEHDEGPFLGRVPQTEQELFEMAASPEEAVTAYQFASQHAPHLLPDVLAEVQFHDPGLAKRMEIELYQSMLQSSLAPVQQTMQQSEIEARAAQTVAAYGASVENWDDIRHDVAKVIEEEQWLVGDGTPAAVERGLRAATRMVQQARNAAVAQSNEIVRQQGVEQRRQAVVETGTPSAAPVVEEADEAQSIRDAIFAEDKRRREFLS